MPCPSQEQLINLAYQRRHYVTRVSGKIGVEVIKSGREPLLNLEEENCLVQHIKVMASCGYGYSRSEVVDMASTYAVALGKRDGDHRFSLMWFHNFIKRWPDLKVRKPRSLEQGQRLRLRRLFHHISKNLTIFRQSMTKRRHLRQFIILMKKV